MRTNISFTIATRGVETRSASVMSRPPRTDTPNAAIHPGVTALSAVYGSVGVSFLFVEPMPDGNVRRSSCGVQEPDTYTCRCHSLPLSGAISERPLAATPGTESTRS